LTAAGRLRLVLRCEHRPIAHVAAEAGISRQCLSKWKARFDELGEVGLADRASVPHRSPTQLDPDLVAQIETWRRQDKWTARQIALELRGRGHVVSVATVGRWLVRLGINRRRDIDPDGSTNRTGQRITARYPGHMVHLDVKKAGRIPDGGGWRAHGRGSAADKVAQRAKAKGARAGYVYLHSAIDGYSRLGYTEHLRDEKASTTIGFFHRARAFFAAHGITRMVRVITDNGPNYTSRAFHRTATAVARHQRIRPFTPGTTARSSATTGPWPKSSSTLACGPARPTAPTRSRSGTSTTTTIEPTLPSGTSPPPHASTQASPTS